jgi:hypothetical protein
MVAALVIQNRGQFGFLQLTQNVKTFQKRKEITVVLIIAYSGQPCEG